MNTRLTFLTIALCVASAAAADTNTNGLAIDRVTESVPGESLLKGAVRPDTMELEATNSVVAFSNALMTLLLPRVAEFAAKLDLPERQCTAADVARFDTVGRRVAGYFTFKSGNIYHFEFGCIRSFESPHSFFNLQDPGLIPRFYGPSKMTEAEAVELARSAIRRLGYSEESLYADLDPEVYVPKPPGTNTIPHVHITWKAPNDIQGSTVVEVNRKDRRIEELVLQGSSVMREPPALPGFDVPEHHPFLTLRTVPPGDPAARELLPGALPRIGVVASRLGLALPNPLTSNEVAEVTFMGWPSTMQRIRLTNGYVFTVSGRVLGYAAPGAFFTENKHIRLRDFAGPWNLSQEKAIALARETARKLGIEPAFTADPPRVFRAKGAARDIVPRYEFSWSHGLMCEVDANTGTVKWFAALEAMIDEPPARPDHTQIR